MRKFYLILLLIFSLSLFSQTEKRKQYSSLSAQFAGSVGFWSVGYHRVLYKEKLYTGFVFGNTPKYFGGNLSSISVKLKYSPFRIPVYKKVSFEPLQAGFFLVQNFGENLRFRWPSRYHNGYYWWGSSFRQHIFLSSQLSLKMKEKFFRRIGTYFEVNTNDLYIASYINNKKSLSVYDIVFFGIGVQATFK